MIEWRTARLLMVYVLLMGAFLTVIAGVQLFQGHSTFFRTVSVQSLLAKPSISPTPRSSGSKVAPRPDVNPILTIPENPPSIFANDETYVGHEPNSEGQDYSF